MRRTPYRVKVEGECSPELERAMNEDITGYLRGRTEEDPYFAVMTLAIHGASVPYSRSQYFVEQLVRDGANKNLDFDFVHRTLTGNPDEPYKPDLKKLSYMYAPTASRVVVQTTECYLEECGEDGKACLASPARDRLDACVADIKNVGVKGRALMMQYLGDNRKMPIDRHVVRYVCSIDDNNELDCPIEVFGQITPRDRDEVWRKTLRDFHRQWGKFPETGMERMVFGRKNPIKMPFDSVIKQRLVGRIGATRQEFIDDNYEQIEKFLHKKAASCGYDPVKFHNAMWLYSVCATDAGNKEADVKEEVFMGEGKVVDCRDILDGGVSDSDW